MDRDWLRSIGVDGSEKELAELEELVAEALELRVGTSLAEVFTPVQLDEFEALVQAGKATEADRLIYLSEIYPEYPTVVAQETERLRRNIERSSDRKAYIHSLA